MPDHPHGPARRGRKDPALAAELELALDPDLLGDDDQPDPEPVFLFEGDIVSCKITREVEIVPRHSSFFSYGVVTRVQPDEDDEDTFVRVATVVHTAVNRLVEADVEAYETEQRERSTRPITPRQ